MEQPEVILYIVKVALGGIAAFLAILLWSHTRDSAWMSLVAGMVTSYASVVLEMMAKFGMLSLHGPGLFGLPVVQLVFAAVPWLFFILAFILMLLRNR